MATITRSPEGTEFENDEGHPWLCLNCGMVPTDPEFCDNCQFPRHNQPGIPRVGSAPGDDAGDWYRYEPGAATIDTPPTDPPDQVDPGSHGGML
jgi:hypothetical protein